MAKCKHLNVTIIEFSKVASTLDIDNGITEKEMYHSDAKPVGYSIKCHDCKVYYEGSTFRNFPKWANKYWDNYCDSPSSLW
jgi:hypothetical protein